MGFIFYNKSSRFFEGLIPNLDGGIKKVGVFVNASAEEIKKQMANHKLDLIQLHGSESPEFCKQFTSVEVIKVFAIDPKFDFNQIEAFENACNYFLFDTKGKHPGGNGYKFDWELLKNYTSQKPYFLRL